MNAEEPAWRVYNPALKFTARFAGKKVKEQTHAATSTRANTSH